MKTPPKRTTPAAQKLRPSKPNIGKGDWGFTDMIGIEAAYKGSSQAEACGSADELNAAVGECHCRIRDARVRRVLYAISCDLFVLGADLANSTIANKTLPRITAEHVRRVEYWIVEFERGLPPIRNFILPIASPAPCALNFARAVCRRAERQAVRYLLEKRDEANPLTLAYLNRLGDLFFTLGRAVMARSGEPETYWSRDGVRREQTPRKRRRKSSGSL